ncbi:MAG: tRNA (cytidine(34)-2'-O)-methyltransferase [Candidatus Izemoplasmataceae bacterium]|jgi:tRNA (cytidine/uridine-2'-O-)-methyltransferase|uniref:tRNA (cytidine(34)-2'-O)-methyltransferase n=1 Tax=Liberiplasma polymorphum TaxID=3374570 RepID=UPI003773A0D6
MNHIVLYQPEIPQNTGNIMRTCVATSARLHLIKPLGFSVEEKYMKRSAANYLEHLDMHIYENFEAFTKKNKGQFYFLTRYGEKSPDQFDFSQTTEDIYLIFGNESSGMPKELLQEHLDRCLRLPMTDKVRSLNLSNTAAILIYEVLRQQNYRGLIGHEPDIYKGKDYLKK